jgi:hypothetical protein
MGDHGAGAGAGSPESGDRILRVQSRRKPLAARGATDVAGTDEQEVHVPLLEAGVDRAGAADRLS